VDVVAAGDVGERFTPVATANRLAPLVRGELRLASEFHALRLRVDDLDYLLTLARLSIIDASAGREPETPADKQRQRDRERIERAFPKIGKPGAVIPHHADSSEVRID
jgi:hypothetical protein